MKKEMENKEEHDVKKGSYIQSGRFEPRKKIQSSDTVKNMATVSEGESGNMNQDRDQTHSRIKPFINMYDPFG